MKERKEMTYDETDDKDSWYIDTLSAINSISDNKSYEFMQFTGLKDKNGKEIFEGDIIRWVIFDDGWDGERFNLNKNRIMKEGIGKVYWALDHYKIRGCKKTISSLVCFGSKEVIGNIYENPELLEAK